MSASQPPMDLGELDPVGRAASAVLAVVVNRDPQFQVTPAVYDAVRDLVESIAALLVSGGAR
jgi:hypothetical protein